MQFPGFLDLQVNGFGGVDFNEPCTPQQIQHAIEAQRACGVTQFLPTIITSSLEHFASCVRSIVNFSDPAIVGIHMEGPYISPEDGPRGAHLLANVYPASIEDFKLRQDAANGKIILVTLAPEVSFQSSRMLLGPVAVARRTSGGSGVAYWTSSRPISSSCCTGHVRCRWVSSACTTHGS